MMLCTFHAFGFHFQLMYPGLGLIRSLKGKSHASEAASSLAAKAGH